MGIDIVPYGKEFIDAVRAFNARLRAGGVTFQFSESHISDWLPKIDGRQTYEEYFLAVENGFVRGGYVLKHQPFWVRGELRSVGNLQLPLSEGTVNRAYRTLGVSLLTDVMRREPLLYGLGFGGMDNPLVKMLQALGWTARPVPFYFRVVHPARFLRHISHLRTSPFRRLVLDGLAVTGAGWLGFKLAQALRRRAPGRLAPPQVEIVPDFAAWCDTVWDRAKTDYALIGLRDHTTLNLLCSRNNPRFVRLKVARDGEVVGWAVVLATPMSGHKQFGRMTVGSIVDCLGRPEDVALVISAATAYLERAGVDVIVCNQAAESWGQALLQTGYWSGPSNHVLAVSKELARRLEPFDAHFSRLHVTRGDGEGPSHL